MKFIYAFLLYFLSWWDVCSQKPYFLTDSSALFAKQITGTLPEAGFYFIGQLHNNAANTILEKELLFSLNKRFSVSYDILEYSHSVAVILNEYLITGQDSLLDFIDQNAGFSFIRSVKQFNDTVNGKRKIKFYGIDFEGRDLGKYTKRAMSIILQRNISNDSVLFHLVKACGESDATMLSKNLVQLKNYLAINKQKAREIPGDRYLDLLLITNAPYGFSPKRDKAMYNNFNLLYNELSNQLPGKPKFFGSFGIGHINPDNPKGIANVLNFSEDSPVKNNVTIVGVHYFNCFFNSSNTFKESKGVLEFLCKQKSISTMSKSTNSDKPILRYIPGTEFNYPNCDKSIKQLKGIVIIENFNATANWTWE